MAGISISDSCGLDFILPADTLKELPDVDGLIKFIDAVRLDGEPALRPSLWFLWK